MVSHLRTPILKSFYYLLWFQIVSVSEFSCLASHFLCLANTYAPDS